MKINPAILREALITKDIPKLIFDFEKIEENLRSFKKITTQTESTWSFAVKSLSHPEMIDLVGHFVDGFDISNIEEWHKIEKSIEARHTIWLTNSNLAKDLDIFSRKVEPAKLFVTINDLSDYKFIKDKNVNFILRLSTSDLIPQPINSRFGLRLEEISKIQDDLLKNQNFKGFHIHQGIEDNTPEILKNILNSILLRLNAFFGNNYYFNLGGSLHQFSEIDLVEALSFLKDKFKIHIEPGRAVVKNAGFCLIPVEKYFLQGEELRLFSRISFLSHLKWSHPKIVGILNDTHELESFSPKSIVIEGSTCYEFDRSQPFAYGEDVKLAVGSIILLSDITGYSSEWNTSFNGVPRLDVKFLGRKLRSSP